MGKVHEDSMRTRRPRRADNSYPCPIVPVVRRPAVSPLFFYPAAHSWSQVHGLPRSGVGGPHPLLKFAMVLFCGLTLLSGCTGSFRQQADDASLRYLADAEEVMPIPYTPRDDGQPLSPEELHAFKTVSDLDRHLSEEEARIVELHFKHYLHQMRGSFNVYLKRSARFMPYVKQVFASRGIPDDIAYLFMVESGGNPVAQSHAGAVGLWQFMPATGKIYGLQQDNWLDERRDPYKATVAAANYLKRLHREFCNWHLAVAAYNAGEGKIGRAVSGTGASDFFDLCRLDQQLEAKARLKDETRDYVPRLIAVAKIMRNLDRLGLMRPTQDMAWNLVPMNVPPLTDLNALAWQLGLSWEAFLAMNPAYLRAASPPQQTVAYVPPERLAEAVRWASGPEARIYAGWKEYTIRKGDSLTALAKRSKVSVDAIKKANLLTALPRQGKIILIPGEKPEGMVAQTHPAVQPDAAALMASSGVSLRRPFPLGGHPPAMQQAKPGTITASRPFFPSPIEKHATRLSPPTLAAVPGAPAATGTPGATRGYSGEAPQPVLLGRAGQGGPAPDVPAKNEVPAKSREEDARAKEAAAPAVEKRRIPVAAAEKPSRGTGGKAPDAAVQTRSAERPKAATGYYRVQAGDTMYSLAKKWGTDVASIRAANKMDKNKTTVKLGQRLAVPPGSVGAVALASASGSAGAVAPASGGKEAQAKKKAASATDRKSGGTATASAPAASTSAASSAAPASVAASSKSAGVFNPLKGRVEEEIASAAMQPVAEGRPIQVDYDEPEQAFFSERELILGSYVNESPYTGMGGYRTPSASAPEQRSGQAPLGYAIPKEAFESADIDEDGPQVFYNVYVKKGESLERIAREHGVSVRALREANSLGADDKLKVGQKILVPQS